MNQSPPFSLGKLPFIRAGSWAALGTLMLLTGCALAPGVPERLGLAGAPRTPTGESPASPSVRLTPITPALVQQLRQPQRGLSAEVRSLITPGPAPTYRIGVGDVLAIAIWNEGLSTTDAETVPAAGTSSSTGYPVGPDGRIQFPYIGSLPVQGLTETEMREHLLAALSRYLRKPNISARIQTFRSARIYLDGEVRSPGLQVLDDIAMTLPEAIGRAGGFTATADRTSIALTRASTTTHLNLADLVDQGINPLQIRLQAGDLLRVMPREESKVYVLGEVLKPSTLLLREGRLRLGEALGEAGGISPISANPSQVYVVRSSEGSMPEVFHLDASQPISFALADGFPLRARDIVYVDPAPIVRWNRVISLLLPSAGGINTVRDLSQ